MARATCFYKVISVLLLLQLPQISIGRVITIGANQKYKSIALAVDFASNFDTLLIEKGIYKEKNIVVNKSLRLIGRNDPVLDGEGKYQILILSGTNFLVEGITFKNSGYSSLNDYASIKVIDASDFRIQNNTVINASFAIHIANCKNFVIAGNNIMGTPREEQNTGNGIHLWKCNNALIENNKVSGQRDGIYFEFVTNSKIQNNRSFQNMRYGLHFMFSNNDTYSGNNFTENGAGVAVMFSHHVNMLHNTFAFNRGGSSYGILLKEINDGVISYNSFANNTVGIFMEGTNRILVNENIFKNNGWAFKIQSSCSAVTVKGNLFISNTFDIATNGTLVLNTFINNYWDKYEGYDMNKDGIGDVPYHPVSLFSIIAEKMPYSILLFRSFMVMMLDRMEDAVPALIPVELKDDHPLMKSPLQ